MHQAARDEDSRLSARIESFELAFRMQTPRLRRSTSTMKQRRPETLRIGEGVTTFRQQCLLARRLTERGVRMVQVYHTQTSKRSSCQLWTSTQLKTELPNNCLATDKPIAAY